MTETVESFPKLYVELASWSHDISPLRLLTAVTWCRSGPPFKLRVFSKRNWKSHAFSSIDAMMSRLAEMSFNLIQFEGSKPFTPQSGIRLSAKVDLMFEVSPSNRLWNDAREGGGSSFYAERTRESLESLQIAVNSRGIDDIPTALKVLVSIASPFAAEVDDIATEWLVGALRLLSIPEDCVGTAELLFGSEDDIRPSFAGEIAKRLRHVPDASAFDKPYWGMIGNSRLCKAVSERFSSESKQYELSEDPNHPNLVRIANPKLLLRHNQRPKGAPSATWTNLISPPTETLAEYQHLDRAGMKPRLTYEILHFLIGETYLPKLGIKAEDMLVIPMHRLLSGLIFSEIKAKLNSADRQDISAEQILSAHEEVMRRHLNARFVDAAFARIRSSIPPSKT